MDSGQSGPSPTSSYAVPKLRVSRFHTDTSSQSKSNASGSTTIPVASLTREDHPTHDGGARRPIVTLSSEGERDPDPEEPAARLRDVMARFNASSVGNRPGLLDLHRKANSAPSIRDSDLETVNMAEYQDMPVESASMRSNLRDVFEKAMARPVGNTPKKSRHALGARNSRRRASLEGKFESPTKRRRSMSDDEVSFSQASSNSPPLPRPLSRAESFDLLKDELNSSMLRSALERSSGSNRAHSDISLFDHTLQSLQSADFQETSTPPHRPTTIPPQSPGPTNLQNYVNNAILKGKHKEREYSPVGTPQNRAETSSRLPTPKTAVPITRQHSNGGGPYEPDNDMEPSELVHPKFSSGIPPRELPSTRPRMHIKRRSSSPSRESQEHTRDAVLLGKSKYSRIVSLTPRQNPPTSASSRTPLHDPDFGVPAGRHQTMTRDSPSIDSRHQHYNQVQDGHDDAPAWSPQQATSDLYDRVVPSRGPMISYSNGVPEGETDSVAPSSRSVSPVRQSPRYNEEQVENQEQDGDGEKNPGSNYLGRQTAYLDKENQDETGTETETDLKIQRNLQNMSLPAASSSTPARERDAEVLQPSDALNRTLFKTPKFPGSWGTPSALVATPIPPDAVSESNTYALTPAPPGGLGRDREGNSSVLKSILKVRFDQNRDRSQATAPEISSNGDGDGNDTADGSGLSTNPLILPPSAKSPEKHPSSFDSSLRSKETSSPSRSTIRVVDALGVEVQRETPPSSLTKLGTSMLGRLRNGLAGISEEFPPTPNQSMASFSSFSIESPLNTEDEKTVARMATSEAARANLRLRQQDAQSASEGFDEKMSKARRSYLLTQGAMAPPVLPRSSFSRWTLSHIRLTFLVELSLLAIAFLVFRSRAQTSYVTTYYDPFFPALFTNPAGHDLAIRSTTMLPRDEQASWWSPQAPLQFWNYVTYAFWSWWRQGGWEGWSSAHLEREWVPT